MTRATNLQAPKGVEYLDSYTSCHLTNTKDLFIDELWPKYLDFTTTGRQTIWVERIGIIAIPLVNSSSINLEKMV